MRCGRCGNENAEANRFCGMCGAPLVAKDQAGPPVSAPEVEPRMAPVITGPSFLGLNAPAPEKDSRRAGLKEDHVAGLRQQDPLRPSSNVDYLLEDDEEPRRGWGKLILVVVALALAVGFGYLHWKRGGFDWLNADKKPTAATAQAPDAGSGTDSGAATTTAPVGGAIPPQVGSGTTPAGGGAASPAPQTTAPQASSQAPPLPSAAAQGAPAQTTPVQTTTPPGEPQSASPSNAGDSGVAAGSRVSESDSDKQPPAAEVTPKAVTRRPAAAKPAVTKPTPAKPAAAKPVDSVTEAERYIYGRGAEQDCDRGLRLLKPAAEQANVKAMVSMGVLYSTGTCTPRDLPTAYRWFALALHKEPDNQALQDDLQNLWGKMTPPERQLAIKLSQ